MDTGFTSLQAARRSLDNEDGIIIVLALLILVLLTIVGISSTNISNTEVKIAGYEVVYLSNLYRAEGATLEAVEVLENMADPKTEAGSWLEAAIDSISDEELRIWQFGGSPAPEASTLDFSSFIVASEGIYGGSSLDMSSSKVHTYAIYGHSAPPNQGATTVQIGYLKAF
jgi:hypothetical protein